MAELGIRAGLLINLSLLYLRFYRLKNALLRCINIELVALKGMGVVKNLTWGERAWCNGQVIYDWAWAGRQALWTKRQISTLKSSGRVVLE